MLALIGAVLFLVAAIINLVHDPVQLNDLLKLLALVLIAIHLAELWRRSWKGFDLAALIAATLFVIAALLEVTRYPATTDILLTTVGFIFVSLFLAGVGPRTVRRI
jgi:glucose-6-phosphate-specific signal transduction histidine kinase